MGAAVAREEGSSPDAATECALLPLLGGVQGTPLFAPPNTYCRIHHLPLQEGSLASSEVETCVTSGFPGLGGEKRPSVWSHGHMGKGVPMNNDISRTFQSHQKLASWGPHSGLAGLFHFHVFPTRQTAEEQGCGDNREQL